MKSIVTKIKRIYWTWYYRFIPEDLCCCGGSMNKHCSDFVCRSAKEYAITESTEGRWNKKNGKIK